MTSMSPCTGGSGVSLKLLPSAVLQHVCVCVTACVCLAGTSWVLDCTWAGQRPLWPSWGARCSAAPTDARPRLPGRSVLQPVCGGRDSLPDSSQRVPPALTCEALSSSLPLQTLFLQAEESGSKHLQGRRGAGRRPVQGLRLSSVASPGR